jgi:dTDP-4-dehydrorhamnose reductase
MYRETDIPKPLNNYGSTKLKGEKFVNSGDLVVRTAIFGRNIEAKKSLVEWIVGELENGREITVFSDSFFTPIYTGHLSEIILEMCEKGMAGLYHAASNERIDKFTFAKAVAGIYGLDSSLVKPGSIKNFERAAKRPIDTSLDCSRIIGAGIRLNDFRHEIGLMKDDRKA